MAHYAIGDIQGCYDELEALLAKIGFSHGRDTLWLTGDIVNRGPKSLEALEFAFKHESSVQTVLGNHDLHLLAVSYGHGKVKRSDTIAPILEHPEARRLLDWLRAQPLMIQNGSHVLVHAGLLPQWSIPQAEALAREVETELQSSRAEPYFANMYGNKPVYWHNGLQGFNRLRMITNVFTRMRALTADGGLDYGFKSTLEEMPPGLMPWFDAPERLNLDRTIVFGHWSALGIVRRRNVLSLDTGALWGGQLSAADLDTGEIVQVDAKNGLKW